MTSNVTELAALVVTAGAVAFGLITALWAFRFTQAGRSADMRWRRHAERLEARLDRADALLAAHPGVVLAWDDEAELEPGAWGKPKLFGAPAALASLLRFADASDGPNLGARILDGLADYEGRDAAGEVVTLRRALGVLRASGTPFSIAIQGPGGRIIDADGRPAGARVALWLADPTLKSAESAAARGRLEEAREQILQDPGAFMDMWDRAPTPAWRYSSNLKLQWANPAFLQAVEADSLDDAIGRDLAFDVHAKAQARQALEEGARVYHTRATTVGGERRVFEISCFPVSGGVSGVAADLTAGEQERAELERKLRRQTAALNRVDDGVAILSPQKALIFHNDAFAQLFGLEAAWLAEGPTHGALLDRLRDMRMLPETDDYEAWRTHELQIYLKTSDDRAAEIWRLPDGRMISVTPMRHALGGVILIYRDITERLRLETELNTRVKVQKTTLDKLAEGVAVFGSDGRLRLYNAAFEEMWALPTTLLRADDRAAGASATTFDEIVEACRPLFHDRDTWAKMKARVTNPSPETRREARGEMVRSDGTILTFTSRPLPDGATSIVFDNVTADRELAEALKERAELLEAVDRVRAEFVGHVSRALRDPLQTVLMRAELLKMDAEDEARVVKPDDVDGILQAGGALNKLVNDILDIAAIESNVLTLDMSDVDVRAMLEGALGLVRTKAEDTRIRFEFDCAPDVGSVHADAQRLKQVVYNLLLNGLRRVDSDGRVALGASREGASVRIWVEDDGPAISPQDQAKVFDPFHVGEQGGADLGLTLVRGFVALHKGWVDVRSGSGEGEASRGARVTCTLPTGPEAVGDARSENTAAADASSVAAAH